MINADCVGYVDIIAQAIPIYKILRFGMFHNLTVTRDFCSLSKHFY